MGIFDRFFSKRKPQPIKNNIPKEKARMRQTFGVYCNKHHGTTGESLCPKCTALLSSVMVKMNHCPYGVTKPVCDKCEIMCFGTKNKEFMEVMMSATSSSMFLKHPITALKHKLAKIGADLGKQKAANEKSKKAEAKAKKAKKKAEEKAKAKEKESDKLSTEKK